MSRVRSTSATSVKAITTAVADPYTLELRAKVAPPALDAPLSQASFAVAFNVSDQTLRTWTARGMPTRRGDDGRPKYGADAITWAIHWQAMQRAARQRNEPAPQRLNAATAAHEDLLDQLAEDPTGFVVVPLDADHPMRRALLARAAAGR